MPFEATGMDLELLILSEVGQTETNTIRYHLHMESKVLFSIFTKQTHRHRRQTHGYQSGKGVWGDKLGVWD